MREIEFLPAWYPRLRAHKRMVMLQLWSTLLVAAGLGLWTVRAQQNVHERQRERAAVGVQLAQSRAELKELNHEMDEKQKLEAEQRIVSKVGIHVEASRLLRKLDEIMPREMTLTEANFDTIEQTKSGNDPSTDKTVSRKTLVKLSGVTPSDADWAGVLAKLSSVPYFQDVRLVEAHDKTDSGHLMREFDVSFVVDLGGGE